MAAYWTFGNSLITRRSWSGGARTREGKVGEGGEVLPAPVDKGPVVVVVFKVEMCRLRKHARAKMGLFTAPAGVQRDIDIQPLQSHACLRAFVEEGEALDWLPSMTIFFITRFSTPGANSQGAVDLAFLVKTAKKCPGS